MTQFISDNALLHAAYNQAFAALRAGKGTYDYARAQNRMFDTLERCKYPRLTTMRLAKWIGPSRAMVLGIDRPIINLGLTLEMENPGC